MINFFKVTRSIGIREEGEISMKYQFLALEPSLMTEQHFHSSSELK